VPNSDDNQNPSKSLPSPELNPLTNPVLGRNMGRWAEVYFTSPPEKREQAVQELLRELERSESSDGGPAPATTAPGGPSQPAEEARTLARPTSVPAAFLGEEFVQCRSCGRAALAEQQFCGVCGAPLPAQRSLPDAVLRDGGRTQVLAASEPARLGTAAEQDLLAEKGRAEENVDPFPTMAGSSAHDSALSWQAGGKPTAEAIPRLFLEHQRARRRRSRRLMAAALTILVGTLFYVAARVTSSWLRADHALQQDATKEVHSATAHSTPVPQVAKPDEGAPGTVDHNLSPAKTELSPARHDEKTRAPEEKPSGALSAPQMASVPTNVADRKLNPFADRGGPGAEELAIAESYLSGTQGKARDSGQAAEWLWKSVAKQNAAAAVRLSDLYVTGDGVPQNCDQARLLLNAASRRATPGAEERIRNLPNAGCP
jgi:hypothetical protein